MPTSKEAPAGDRTAQDTFVVDCDVHPMLPNGISDVFPYMSKSWRERFASAAETQHTFGFLGGLRHPLSPLKVDAQSPSGGPPGSDPEFTRVDLLDRMSIDRALLVPLLGINGWVNPDEATVVASAYNEYFLEHWAQLDDRYNLAMMVAALDPLEAAAEIRRFGSRKGVVGVYMPVTGVMMGHRSYYPIYEAAQELDLPIVYHATAAEGTYPTAPTFAGGVPSSYPEFFTIISQIAESGIVNMLWEGVFERFPHLKFLFLETAYSWVPHIMWRLDSGWRSFRHDRPWVKRPPSEYLREHVRFASQPYLEPPKAEYVSWMLEMMHADETMVFSTDYPHWDGDDPELILPRVARHGSPELVKRVLGTNALELFPRMDGPRA